VQTFARGIIHDLLLSVVDRALQGLTSCQPQEGFNPRVTTVVTSFEPMSSLPIVSASLRLGPSMRYLAAWGDKPGPADATRGVSILNDRLSNSKLRAYWEGLVLQAGTSSKKVRLGDVKPIARKNAYLSLLLSTARHDACSVEEGGSFDTRNEAFPLAYEDFEAFFGFPPRSVLADQNQEENAGSLELPLAYLRKHFQILAQSATSLADGYQSVRAGVLLQRVHKDVQDHPPTVSDDPSENYAGLETTQAVCQELETAFVGQNWSTLYDTTSASRAPKCSPL
jgi:hypothetical protein